MKEFVFKVQVAAYHHPENYNNNARLANAEKIQTANIDETARFTVGTFDTLKEAMQFKKKIVKRGAKDVFITAKVNEKRKYLMN